MTREAGWKPAAARVVCGALATYATVLALSLSQPSAVLEAAVRAAVAWAERARRTPTPSWMAAPRSTLARGGGAVPMRQTPLDVEARYGLGVTSPVTRVVEWTDTEVVAATFDEGLFRWDAARDRFQRWDVGVDARVNDLAVGADGALYVATGGGAYRVEPHGRAAQLGDGAFTAAGWWRGHAYFTSRRGLSRAEGRGLWTRGPPQGFAPDQPAALAACGEVLCVGAVDGLWLFDGEHATHASSASDALPTDWVTATSAGGDAVWAGTMDGGLARWDARGWRRFSPEDGLPDGRVQPHALAAVAGGAMFASPSGLWALRGDTLVALKPAQELSETTALAAAADGSLWIGGAGTVTKVRVHEEELR